MVEAVAMVVVGLALLMFDMATVGGIREFRPGAWSDTPKYFPSFALFCELTVVVFANLAYIVWVVS